MAGMLPKSMRGSTARRAWIAALLSAVAIAATGAIAAEPVKFAMIEWVAGPVEVVNARGQSRPAWVSEAVLSGETIQTGPGGEMHVRTEDAGFIAFRPNSQVRIDSYMAAGGKEDNLALSLLRGALRSVTGWIGKTNSPRYSVRTPTATIGIRGTDHETHYVPPHAGTDPNLPPPGTYDKVNAGSTVLQNAGGQVVIGTNQSAHAPHDAKAAPRLLDRAPSIYKPGANDGRVEARKTELAREIESRLQERLKDLHDAKDGKDLKDVKDQLKERADKADPGEVRRKTTEKRQRRPGDK